MPTPLRLRRFAPLLVAGLAACAGRASTISGTRIADDSVNRAILQQVESYRQAVERRDAQALLLMASQAYWEDSGTPSGSDDYGVDGLREVLSSRFQKADDIRYAMKYVSIRRACPSDDGGVIAGCRAHVEVLIDASYSVMDARNSERRPDMRDQNELVLEWTGDKWLFVSGM
ncbi:MAG: hypothetical protein KBG28_25405 [Kofleriaceae bacterium]|jgi:hypothetical protein|nr:hypothetical protein [Kofleriaceae bacterium]MBP6838127.1 hypothetical protein [Kofleriaceae bacterium]MBP9207332.1 hypothetical protein [Kofleriaceae bacterium]